MIHDVDESLRTLVRREALNGSRVEIGFDAPTREWSARQNTPTVSLYLYDVREDLQRREVAWEPMRGTDGIATEHRQPARRFRLSYLITAWTQRPEDEHRLLSALLGCFLRYPVLPSDVLAGSLTETTIPLLTTIALPPPADRSIADVWSALGGELKPSLDLVVTAPMDSSVRIEAAPPVRESPLIRVVRPDGSVDEIAGDTGSAAGRVGRRAVSPGEPAVQEETVSERQETQVPTAGDGPTTTRRGRRGKPGSGPPTIPSTAQLPGRRIIIRGIRRP